MDVNDFLNKYENKFLDGDEKEALKRALDEMRQKIDAIQEKRYFQYGGEDGIPVNMPEEERDLQMELTDLQRKILKCLSGLD